MHLENTPQALPFVLSVPPESRYETALQKASPNYPPRVAPRSACSCSPNYEHKDTTDGPGNAPAETLTQAELDTLECGEPGCTSHDHSVIYMNCNACSWDDQRLAVCYEKASGEILVECRTCERELARIAVKES